MNHAKQFLFFDRLGDVLVEAGCDCPFSIALDRVRGDRNHGHRRRGRRLFESPQRTPAIEHGKREIHEDQIRSLSQRGLDRGQSINGRINLELTVQHLADQL